MMTANTSQINDLIYRNRVKMDKQNYIEQQKERGLQILRDLYDLDKIAPSIKISEGLYFNLYGEERFHELEEKVRNWQSETISILSVIGLNLDLYKDIFQSKETITSIWDKRKGLADEIQSGLLYLANIEDDKSSESSSTEEVGFLRQDIRIETYGLNLIPELIPIINSRIDEIKKGLNALMPLSVIILSGSTLEGILLNIAKQKPESFNKAQSSPKDENMKVKPYSMWTLQNFIDVAAELDYLKEDTKKFSHALRDFRNYIHPHEQLKQEFNPDMHTAEICFQVLKAAISQISKKLAYNNRYEDRLHVTAGSGHLETVT